MTDCVFCKIVAGEHVAPRHTDDGLVIIWPAKHPPSDELAAYAARIKPE